MQSHLTRAKDVPLFLVIKKITRVLGPLCQEPGAEANIYIYFFYVLLATQVLDVEGGI